jgi:alpha-beta hydrolase superfamily lysophospholipase
MSYKPAVHRGMFRATVALLALSSAPVTFSAATDSQPASERLPRHAILGAGAVGAVGGIKVTVVVADSAAARAGLQVGDIVNAIGTQQIATAADFLARVKALPTGKPIDFSIVRDGAPLKVSVLPNNAPNEKDPAVKTLYQAVSINGNLQRVLLTVPDGVKHGHPAVLVIGGIGCYSIDNATDGEDAYLRLTHDLGRRGIAAMRLEKSGVGDSQGPPCMTVDLLTEMSAYAAALDSLARNPEVDPKRIFLFGHSIGTLIAPRIARGREVAGIVIAEGVGRNWIEYELANLRRQLELDGTAPDKVDAQMSTKEACMHRLLIERTPEADIETDQPACKQMNAYPASAGYLQQAAALNIAEPWMNLSVPVLAIYGTADFITTQLDHQRIVDIVNAGHPGLAALTRIEGMDHHLDFAGTPQQAYDLRVKEHRTAPYQAEFSKAVADWICAQGPGVCAEGRGSPASARAGPD